MKTKPFDCVEMMHNGADSIMEEIKGMTLDPQVAYWKKATEELRQLQQKMKAESKSSRSNSL